MPVKQGSLELLEHAAAKELLQSKIPARLAYIGTDGNPRVVPEYAAAAERYFGSAQGKAWVEQLGSKSTQMVRISIKPEWVGLLDFQTRFPSALSA